MNDIFNTRRFAKFFATDFRTCASNYGLSISLISLMGMIIYAGTVVMGLIFKHEWGGPELGFRLTTFAVCMAVLVITMPVKCYGAITDKKAGTDWLMIPVSQIEKTLSMVVMTIFVAPLIAGGIYLSIDSLLCAIDKTCGESILQAVSRLIVNLRGEITGTDEVMVRFLRQITCPWLYIDDMFGISLIFLLGAVLFNKGKTVKTFLSIMAISTAASMILIPLTQIYFNNAIPADGIHNIAELEPFIYNTVFRHAALIDTINDTIVNLLLLAGIYLRIKTIKH